MESFISLDCVSVVRTHLWRLHYKIKFFILYILYDDNDNCYTKINKLKMEKKKKVWKVQKIESESI